VCDDVNRNSGKNIHCKIAVNVSLTLHGWNEDNPAESSVIKDNVSAFLWQWKQNKWNPCFTEKVFHNYHQSTALNDFGSAPPLTKTADPMAISLRRKNSALIFTM